MREIVFSMRLSQEEHDAWMKAASRERRTLTDYVRLSMNDKAMHDETAAKLLASRKVQKELRP